jgi:hypothetical protein
MSRALYHLSYGTAGRWRAPQGALQQEILSRGLCPSLQLPLLGPALRQRHPLPFVHGSPNNEKSRGPGSGMVSS